MANPCGRGVEPFDFLKGNEFLEELSNYCHHKKESALWNWFFFRLMAVWLVDWLIGWIVS